MRYGLLSNASGLHDTWGAHNATLLASLSLAVVAMFALALTMVSVRVFSRSALR